MAWTAARIYTLRRLLGLSQKTFAELLTTDDHHVTRETVKDWERGKSKANPHTALLLDQLRAQHDRDTAATIKLAASGGRVTIPLPAPGGGGSWEEGIAARVLDAEPDADIAWDE